MQRVPWDTEKCLYWAWGEGKLLWRGETALGVTIIDNWV